MKELVCVCSFTVAMCKSPLRKCFPTRIRLTLQMAPTEEQSKPKFYWVFSLCFKRCPYRPPDMFSDHQSIKVMAKKKAPVTQLNTEYEVMRNNVCKNKTSYLHLHKNTIQYWWTYAVVLLISWTLCSGSMVSGQRRMQGANTMASALADILLVSSCKAILKHTTVQSCYCTPNVRLRQPFPTRTTRQDGVWLRQIIHRVW